MLPFRFLVLESDTREFLNCCLIEDKLLWCGIGGGDLIGGESEALFLIGGRALDLRLDIFSGSGAPPPPSRAPMAGRLMDETSAAAFGPSFLSSFWACASMYIRLVLPRQRARNRLYRPGR